MSKIKPAFNYISLLIWSSIAVLPFLTRTRYVPLPQWIAESRVVTLLLVAWLFLALAGSLQYKLPRAAIHLLLVALVLYVQSCVLPLNFPGLSQAAELAFIALALLAYLTFSLKEQYGSELLILYLAWALLIGAMLQSMIGLIQVCDFAKLTNDIIFYDVNHRTSNVFGHIGQRNQYAHYLTWGALSLAYLFSQRKISTWMALPIIFWLSLSIGWSASRTALLYAPIMLVVSAIWHWRLRQACSWRLLKIIALLALSIIVVQFLTPLISHLLHISSANTGVERLSSSINSLGARRWVEWHKAWLCFYAHPLWGVGWSQFAAHSANLQMRPEFAHAAFNNALFTNSHNLFLQLLAETGILGSLVIFGGFGLVLLAYFSQSAKTESILPLGIMAISLTHSMLEYPLWYLYFLAVFVMALSLTPSDKINVTKSHKFAWFFPCLSIIPIALLSFLLIQGHFLYWEMVNLYTPTKNIQINLRQANSIRQIIKNHPLYAYHALSELTNYIHIDRQNMADKLYWLKLMNAFRPYSNTLLSQAKLEALNNQPKLAKQTLKKALLNYPTDSILWINSFPKQELAYKELRIITQRAYDKLPAHYKNSK